MPAFEEEKKLQHQQRLSAALSAGDLCICLGVPAFQVMPAPHCFHSKFQTGNGWLSFVSISWAKMMETSRGALQYLKGKLPQAEVFITVWAQWNLQMLTEKNTICHLFRSPFLPVELFDGTP